MQLKLSTFLALFGLCVLVSGKNFREDFHKGFHILTTEGRETLELKNALEGVKFPHLFRGNYKKNLESTLMCMVCDVGLDIVITASRNGSDIEMIAKALSYICINLGIETEEVCNGVINVNKNTLSYIINDKNSKVTSERICSMVLQDFNCVDKNSKPWTIEIPPSSRTKPTYPFEKETGKAEPIKIVQLTDFHFDPNYEVGSNANCPEPLCCQAGSKPENPADAAGYWGDYRHCDLPWHSVVDTLDQIVIEHETIDYVYFTGDIINHKVWQTDIESNKEAIRKVFKQFRGTFGNVPVFPILGNHEPHPVNQFSYDVENNHEINTKWIFQIAAEQWSHWLPEDTKETILKGGYYTVEVRKGFRIIALNSNVCFTLNFWLFYEDKDPFGQLQWLVDTLVEAEKNNEKVHILSHVPTGDSTCLHNWSNEFLKVIRRFYGTITAQFNGHTHNDDTVLFFLNEDDTPINIAFNGGSLTTYPNLNPNYKVYDVDSDSYDVLDYESWIYNLTEANWDPQVSPRWQKLYGFKEQYNLNEVTPASVSTLIQKMANEQDSKLISLYFKNKNRNADVALAVGCDADCQIDNLCYMVTYVHGYNFHCNLMTSLYNAAHPPSVRNNTK